jgi:hypothetical protein
LAPLYFLLFFIKMAFASERDVKEAGHMILDLPGKMETTIG